MKRSYSPSTLLWKAREVSVSLAACALSAARILGWAWPWLTAEYAERKSRYLRMWHVLRLTSR